MSNFEKSLLKKVLTSEDPIKDWGIVSSRLTDEMIDKSELPYFKFVREYFHKYGEVPTLQLFEETLNVKLSIRATGTVEFYVDEIRKRCLYDKLIDISKLFKSKMDNGDPNSAFKVLTDAVFDIRSQELVDFSLSSVFSTVPDIIERYVNIKEKMLTGIPTPWDTINYVTCGLNPSDFVIIVARPGIGKTWFLTQIAVSSWQFKKKVLCVSLELNKVTMGTRIVSAITRTPYPLIRRAELSEFVAEKFFEDAVALQVGDDKRFMLLGGKGFGGDLPSVEAAIIDFKPDIVCIDGFYLLGLGGHGYERYERISSLSDEVKRMSARYNIPFVVTHQFNRNVRSDKIAGSLDDVSMSDVLGMNADWVFCLLQDEDMYQDKKMIVRALKTRESERMDDLTLNWNFDNMDFSEYNPTKIVSSKPIDFSESSSNNNDDDDEYAF